MRTTDNPAGFPQERAEFFRRQVLLRDYPNWMEQNRELAMRQDRTTATPMLRIDDSRRSPNSGRQQFGLDRFFTEYRARRLRLVSSSTRVPPRS